MLICRSDVRGGFEVKDAAQIKLKASANAGKRDQVSAVSNRRVSSIVASPRSVAVSGEKVKTKDQNRSSRPLTNQDEVKQGSTQRIPNWVPSPRKLFIAQVEEKRRRHSLACTSGGITTTRTNNPPFYPRRHSQITASCEQGRHLSAKHYEVCPTPQRPPLDSCSVMPQLCRNSTSSKLVRRHAFRRPWRSYSQVSGDFSGTLQGLHGSDSFTASPSESQQSAPQLVKRVHNCTAQSVPQHRRYSLPLVNSHATHSPIPEAPPLHSPGSCTMTFFPPFETSVSD